MTDDLTRDPLLDLLARTAKDMDADDSAHDDERWQRWTEGALSAEAEAALADEARRSVPARRMAETYRPLGDDFQDGVVAALRAQPGGGAAAPTPPTADAAPPRRRLWLASAAVLVLAAALSLVFPGSESQPPLPYYELTLGGRVQDQRGTDAPADAIRRYVMGNRLELHLRPASPIEGDVAVVCFLARDGSPQLWDVPVEISSSGAALVAGRLGDELPIEPGAWTVVVAIGRPGELPTADALRDDPAPWTLHSVDFVVDTES